MAFAFALVLVASALGLASGRTMALVGLLSPAWRAQAWVSHGLGTLGAKVARYRELEQQHQELTERVAALERQLAAHEEQIREAQRLRALVALPWPSGLPRRVARIIARAPDAWHLRAVIDLGQSEGVLQDSVLMSHQGALVGRVQSVGTHEAVAQLLGDPMAAVAVVSVRTRAPGVVMGAGGGRLSLRFIDRPEAWRPGDRVVSSGLGGVYPKGLLVGQLVAGQPGLDGEPVTSVLPAADLHRVEEVLVLPPGLRALPAPKADRAASPTPAGARP